MTISKVASRYAVTALACAAGLLTLQSSSQASSLLPQLGASFAPNTGVVPSGYQAVRDWDDDNDDDRPRYGGFDERRFHILPYPYRPHYRYGYGHGDYGGYRCWGDWRLIRTYYGFERVRVRRCG